MDFYGLNCLQKFAIYYTASFQKLVRYPNNVIKICERINDLVKDYDVELSIKEFALSDQSTPNKYTSYKKQLTEMINLDAKVNSYSIKTLAIEITYVWLLSSKIQGEELLALSEKVNIKIAVYFYKIL